MRYENLINWAKTVPEAFDVFQKALDEKVNFLNVMYDEVVG